MRKKFRILVVDDELSIRISLGDLLRCDGYQVEVAENAESALEMLKTQSFDLLMVDVKMPGMDGLEMLKRTKRDDPDTTVVMMTAYGSIDSAVQAMKLGAIDYVIKPFDPKKDWSTRQADFQERVNAARAQVTQTPGAIMLRLRTDDRTVASHVEVIRTRRGRVLHRLGGIDNRREWNRQGGTGTYNS